MEKNEKMREAKPVIPVEQAPLEFWFLRHAEMQQRGELPKPALKELPA